MATPPLPATNQGASATVFDLSGAIAVSTDAAEQDARADAWPQIWQPR